MGGMKRKIAIEKITKKDPRAVAFSKRRQGLYSKASELCLLSSNSQIAVLAAPVSSNSHVSFYSFGHSSADSVVSAFLNNERPREAPLGSSFWWQHESLTKSEDPNELKSAMDSLSSLLQQLKADLKKKELALHGTHLDAETLTLQSNLEGFSNHSEVDEQILAVSDSNNDELIGNLDGCEQEFSLDEIFDFVTESQGNSMDNQNPCSGSEGDEALVMIQGNNLDEGQIVTISESNDNNITMDGYNQEVEFDAITDFETNPKARLEDASMVTTNQNMCYEYSEGAEEGGAMVTHRDFNDEDYLFFSNFFNDLSPIVAL